MTEKYKWRPPFKHIEESWNKIEREFDILREQSFIESKKKKSGCKYWTRGHKEMNCRYCLMPNSLYCKLRFGYKK